MSTGSQVVRFCQDLEEESAELYEQLAKRESVAKDTFQSFCIQNRKLALTVQRAYVSSISDAIEGCFTFRLKEEDYRIRELLTEPIASDEALDRALGLEQAASKFYEEAQKQSQGLLPDVSRAFAVAVRERKRRIAALEALTQDALDNEEVGANG
jgi:rubrerythrin